LCGQGCWGSVGCPGGVGCIFNCLQLPQLLMQHTHTSNSCADILSSLSSLFMGITYVCATHKHTKYIYMYNAHTYIYKYTRSCRTPRHFLDSLLVRVSINNASRRLTSVWLPVWMSGIGLAVCPYVWLSVRMPVRPSVCLTSVYILLPHTDFPGFRACFLSVCRPPSEAYQCVLPHPISRQLNWSFRWNYNNFIFYKLISTWFRFFVDFFWVLYTKKSIMKMV